MRNTKSKIIIMMCAVLCIMAVGYAAFSTALTITGTANIASEWKVVFTKIEQVSKTSGVNIKSTPVASGTSATFDVGLSSPGDKIEYKITVSNQGTLDAVIENVRVGETGSDAIIFEVTGINIGDTLAKKTSTTFNVVISYDENITEQPEILNNKLTIDITYIQQLSGDNVVIPTSVGTMGSGNTITLDSSLPEGLYTLKYEDVNGVMEEYADIATLEVTKARSSATYDDFIEENIAPQEAIVIGVYNESGTRVGSIPFSSTFAPNLGEKLYSFGALSDVHIKIIDEKPSNNFKNALTYLTNVENVDFISVDGDLVDQSTDEHYTVYKSIVDNYAGSTPVYAITGNHDTDDYGNDMENSIELYTGNPLYYSVTMQDDVFIFLGTKDGTPPHMAAGELQWLYETLEENRNKRCFIFTHSFSSNDAGNPLDIMNSNILWNGFEGQSYESLRAHYSNVTVFTGHSHFAFATQHIDDSANYTNAFGFNSIHIPSVSCPRYINEDNSYTNQWEESEGYVVDVYENAIVLRGIDFKNSKFLPIASYYVTTPINSIEKETYVDPGGIIVTDSTKNGLCFDEDGEIRYYVNGVAKASAGLVQDSEGNYYYINSSKKAVKNCNYYINKDNGLGFVNTYQNFDENGRMIIKNGLCFDEDGEIRYYVNGVAKTSAGLVQDSEGNYYYINSSKKAVKNCNYYISIDNGLGFANTYQDFDENGRMIIK